MNKPICVIPARMGSSRFPGKPLVPLLGLPLVFHVYRRCQLYDRFSDVVIATCDTEIRDAAERFGASSVMTSDRHERATDRVREAVDILYPDLDEDAVIVMIQGDELLVNPGQIADVIDAQKSKNANVVNFAARLETEQEHNDPNNVKVVIAPDGRALKFSRAPIPSSGLADDVSVYQQTGIMVFTSGFLRRYSDLPQTPQEIIESVDMLRVLENNLPIHVVTSEMKTLGVDTQKDQKLGEELLLLDPTTHLYLEGGV